MFEGIDPIAQYILAGTILIIVIIVFLIVYKRGVKIGSNTITIGSAKGEKSHRFLYLSDLDIIVDVIVKNVEAIFELNRTERIKRKMRYAQEKLMALRGLKEQRFYKLLKNAGVKQDNLTSHPDAQYYIQVLGNALYYDNGTRSLITALRSSLSDHTEYMKLSEMTDSENRERYNGYLDSFVEAMSQRWKGFFYDNYKTDVIDDDGKHRKRIVTNEDIYDSDFEPGHIKDLREICEDIFDNAVIIDRLIEKEHTKLEKQRKEKTEQIIKLRVSQGE